MVDKTPQSRDLVGLGKLLLELLLGHRGAVGVQDIDDLHKYKQYIRY